MVRVMLTGGSGYLGGHIKSVFEHQKIDFIYTSRRAVPKEEPVLQVDLLDEAELISNAYQLESIQVLIHAAANVPSTPKNISENIEKHIVESVHIINNLINNLPNLKRIVYVSSCSVAFAEKDVSLYSLEKLVGEKLLENIASTNSIDLVILRFPQIFGPDDPHGTFITKFINNIKEEEVIQLVNDGVVSKDVLYVEDAARSIAYAAQSNTKGLFTISPQEAVTVREVLSMLEGILGKKAHVNNKDVSQEEIEKKSYHFISNSSDLGYNIKYTLYEGLKETVEKMRR